MESEATAQLEIEEIEATVDDGAAAEVFCWRLEQLSRAGYSEEVACQVAEDGRIDLHQACDLVLRGCPEGTAYRILS